MDAQAAEAGAVEKTKWIESDGAGLLFVCPCEASSQKSKAQARAAECQSGVSRVLVATEVVQQEMSKATKAAWSTRAQGD